MANTNTDLTEEDAADLQFPKDCTIPILTNINFNNQLNGKTSICANCSADLVAPCIFCVICKVNICKTCFLQGVEFDKHKNNHDYQSIRDDFPLFPNTNWTALEEYVLLDSLERYKNWNLVQRELPKRNVTEIKNHYDYYYLQRNGSKELPEIKETETAVFPPITVPYMQRITNNDDPPRYSPNTIGYKYLAGYNPARSDFESEFDTNAEDLLANMKDVEETDPYYDTIIKLQYALVVSYNRRLQERQRWKKVIRDHGLISFRKVCSWLRRYDLTVTRPVYEKLIRLMQFCTPTQFQMIMEGLHRSGELKIQILRLCSLRQKGITRLADARLYMSLKQIHDKCENELKSLHSNSNVNWKLKRSITFEAPPSRKRSGFTPLEIIGMPGFEKLSVSERELCKNVRLVPVSYVEFKDILIAENKKMGYLELKTARKLLKIDVNKTRRLYDFLVQEGHIVKP